MSAKVPATVRLAKQALVDGKCVVIGLQSTGEARTEEAVTKYVCISIMYSFPYKQIFFCISVFSLNYFFFVKGSELDDFVSGPRELLLKFVEENYPLPEKPQLLPGLRLFCQMILICFNYCGLIIYIFSFTI